MLIGKGLAFECKSFAASFWTIVIINCLLVKSSVYGLNSIGIVVRNFRIANFLVQVVNAAIDDTESVKVNNELFALFIDSFVQDPLILLFEKGAERRTISTSILTQTQSKSDDFTMDTYRFGKNRNLIVVRLVIRKLNKTGLALVYRRYSLIYLLKPCLSKVPQGARGILSVIRCIRIIL